MSFAQRLREERERMELSQEDFAAMGGVKKNAQHNYEKAARMPDVQYLISLAAHQVDVVFILTGRRENRDTNGLTSGLSKILTIFDGLTHTGKAALEEIAVTISRLDKATTR